MQLRVNGKPEEVPDGITVAALLQRLELRRDGVAVAVNRRVVPRGAHGEHPLEEGDEVEVIQAVGGG